MNVTKNGITISIPDAEILRMALDRLGETIIFSGPVTGWGTIEPAAAYVRGISSPRIGEFWDGQGGIHAGIARGRDGTADYHLIVGPEYDGAIGWDAMTSWANGLRLHGFSDFTLPFRKEQALAFANVPELFKPEYYWSCEQHASTTGYAWYQYFSGGGQGLWGKGYSVRGRAFRRLIIQ